MDWVVTKTLAEIYLQQGYLREAYEIYKVLSERDPTNTEIKERLEELSEKLGLSSPLIYQPVSSTEEKICLLEKWLANIRERRRG